MKVNNVVLGCMMGDTASVDMERPQANIQLPRQYFGSSSKPINFFKNLFSPVCRAWEGKDFGSIHLELITQEVIENLKIFIIGYEQNQYFDWQKAPK
jgi:predicted lipid-binding transport protein (Tim44 family)